VAIKITPGPNVNASMLHDNQAEATIAIDPTNPKNLFCASITTHGSISGKFDPMVNVAGVGKDHSPGMCVAYSPGSGGRNTWVERIMATGGPTETNLAERSLPAFDTDPQATFDDFGNLYLTYLSSIHQFGTATGGGGNILTDTARQWVPNMWVGRYLFIRPGATGQRAQEIAVITGNTGTQITVGQNWNKPPAAGESYKISSGVIPPGGGLALANALVIVLSTDAGKNFKFLSLLDAGQIGASPVDYPGVATGPGRNAGEKSVWVAWRGGNNKVMAAGASVTAKGTVASFNTPETVNGSDSMGFPRVQVGPNGQVMVSFHSFVVSPTTIYVNVNDSGLGGGFRDTPTMVSQSSIVVPRNPPFFIIPAQPNRGITPEVNLAWDRSGNYRPAPNGIVYLVYTDLVGAPPGAVPNTSVRSSLDSGVTWSPPQRISGTNSSQFLPSVGVDQNNGDVAVVWLDTLNDPANVKAQLFGTASSAGGGDWLAAVPIAQGQSDVRNANRPQRGFTTSGNTTTTLNDLDQNWTPNNYWRTNFQADPGALGPGTITASTLTQVTIDPAIPWNSPPPSGTAYQIPSIPAIGGNIYSFDYGEYTGLAFFKGLFFLVRADNSNSTADNPDGGSLTLDPYTAQVMVTHPPGVGGINPTSGFTTGGTAVIVTGTNFTGATQVSFGTSPAPPFQVTSDSQIQTTSPAHSAGTVDVTVTSPAGTSAMSPADQFTYVTPAPTVTGVSPNSGTTAGGTPVTITGTNFSGASAVSFGGSPATSFTVNSATQITATSPAHALGTVDVTVTTPGGTSPTTAADRFTYVITPPTVTGISPTSGPTGGGTPVSVTGTNFTGATQVSFGTTPAQGFVVTSDTQIQTGSPPHARGTVDVTVTTPGGTSGTSAADQFSYV
jgi:hypothetical protein